MRNRILVFLLASSFILWQTSDVFALKEDTHRAINEEIAQKTINDFSLNDYLSNSLGFQKGTKEYLNGFDADGLIARKQVFEWLGYGGEQEDWPGNWQDFVLGNPSRSYNHFHNPLKAWSEAGLNDTVLGIPYSGESSVLWSQDTNQIIGGQWSWQTARNADAPCGRLLRSRAHKKRRSWNELAKRSL